MEKMMVIKMAEMSEYAYNPPTLAPFGFHLDLLNPTTLNAEVVDYEMMPATDHIEYSTGYMALLRIKTSSCYGLNPLNLRDCSRYVAVVSFRGTDCWQDWTANFKTLISPIHNFHMGFFTRVKNQFYRIVDTLYYWHTSMSYEGLIDDIIFTGHSLGGAEATIAAVLMNHGSNTHTSGKYILYIVLVHLYIHVHLYMKN